VLRLRRLRRLVDDGILDERAELSPRDPTVPTWEAARYPDWQLARMQAYATQVDRMDGGIGRIVETLRRRGLLDDTLLVFLSDNGASDEELPKRSHPAPAGTPHPGNSPEIRPGPSDTYASYGGAWANLSNTPFRLYKRWVHEGGIATPFVVHWPAGMLARGGVVHTQFQLTDVLPTILEATGADYPRTAPPLAGRSMLPALRGASVEPRPLYWEHTGNAAIRLGDWKLVRRFGFDWELYAMSLDRSELHDLAAGRTEVVRELAAAWEEWAAASGVLAWERILELYRRRGLTEEDAWM
jgi:arylsulfatase